MKNIPMPSIENKYRKNALKELFMKFREQRQKHYVLNRILYGQPSLLDCIDVINMVSLFEWRGQDHQELRSKWVIAFVKFFNSQPDECDKNQQLVCQEMNINGLFHALEALFDQDIKFQDNPWIAELLTKYNNFISYDQQADFIRWIGIASFIPLEVKAKYGYQKPKLNNIEYCLFNRSIA